MSGSGPWYGRYKDKILKLRKKGSMERAEDLCRCAAAAKLGPIGLRKRAKASP